MFYKLSLLIVDDDKNSVDALYNYFRDAGYSAYGACNCNEAIDTLKENKIHAVVADQRMPDMKGTELLTKIKEEMPEITRILLTGHSDFEFAVEAVNKGIIHNYLTKPLDLNELKAILKEQERVRERIESEQRQLAQIDKMASLGIMAAGVVHEINNPLSVAIGDIELFARDIRYLRDFISQFSGMSLPPDIYKEIEKLKKEIDLPDLLEGVNTKLSRCREAMDRVKDIVLHLKDFSHLDQEEITETDVNKSIENSLQLIPEKYKQNIDLKTKFAPLPKISCHGRQISQVFMNIIVNALQAMKDEGMLLIETSSNDQYIYIKFCDTGPGIPEHKIKKIFDPFYTTKPAGEGTGLGLSISFSIIEKHGGNITVTNNADKGVTFTVRLLKNYLVTVPQPSSIVLSPR